MCDLDLYEMYKEDIEDFFAEDEEVWVGALGHPDREQSGHVWIARHPDDVEGKADYETLTVEPEECGGQHEIAVRWKNGDGKWSGYHITEDGYIIGHNTRGH